MQVKGKKRCKLAVKMGLAGAVLLASGFYASSVMAIVTGTCSNCHTMHNSQDASNQVIVGAGAGWSTGATPSLGGAAPSLTPQDRLLKSDCVGCHTATDATKTTITLGVNTIPIVYNLGGTYPAGALAGGNFALNAGAANIYGHNVYGISDEDSTMTAMPGATLGTCNNACHVSLATDPALIPAADQFKFNNVPQGKFNGCQGCHNKVGHHNAADASYRYLGGHGGMAVTNVVGVEDSDWELTKGAGDHNVYNAQTDPFVMDSMGRFCVGCHGKFHAMGIGADPVFGTDNGGDDNTDNKTVGNSAIINPWMRHPTNVNIPNDGDYAAVFAKPYNVDVPVAKKAGGNIAAIEVGDQVMCLSCHRAHASQYPDALRFDYAGMISHDPLNPLTLVGEGCFFCHTNKDD